MKIDRIISIIMLLLERKQISATKLAEMFEVSPRTIFRDVETISLAGIPIVASPGVNGGISIMEEYKIEKKLFTVSDITSLLIGLGSIHSTMTSEEVLNTMAKIKGLVPADQIRDIELKSKQITVDHTPWIGNKDPNVNLEKIRTALSENNLISFKYSAQNGIKSERKIEPYRLVLKSLSWYLQGYCTTRNDFRTFKLSRISSLELLEETFIPREFDYKALEISNNLEKKIIQIKLLIDESIRDLIIEFCGVENIKPHGNNKFIVSFPFTEDDFSYSMILRLGDKCECLEPENVRLEIIRRVENLLNVYKKV
ncbi:helix-turn-helix transcriptional regulator [Clostridium folliculivorans]|uniref:helix-turn-helix transcriptional regulator n=1 Tax=Clostridium folliculivorans TaxID=2886038 RepID=UPI0021C3D956|nr:YafY family protein [Clostridium folliculivorans]GKU30557.1 transcriptional regulator [Clostridium folliculivorans]